MRSLANSMMRFKVLSFGAECFNGVVCGIGDVCMLIKPLKKDCVFYSVFNCSFIHKRGGGVFSVSNPIKMQAHTDISIYVCLHERYLSKNLFYTRASALYFGNVSLKMGLSVCSFKMMSFIFLTMSGCLAAMSWSS